jgi:ring-1,2-phenylacetyl-CoA epoxidase subunit PaaE
MAIHFHTLKVKDVKRETPVCVSVAFEIPDALKNEFAFIQGQNITLKKIINGEELRRSYSVCTTPSENELRVAIKQVEGGLFSTYANQELKQGDELEVMTPSGNFYTPLNPTQKKNYMAFAAGSGITPVISIIKTTLQTEPQSRFTLVYGNRNRGSIIFFEELEELKNRYMERFNLVQVLSRERTDIPLHFGRIDEKKLEELARTTNFNGTDEFFLCGPEEMIFCVKDYLTARGVPTGKIHFELFTSSGIKKKKALRADEQLETGPQSHVTIRLDGREFSFNLPMNSELTVLEAALQQGSDLPYACKGGMCCTCKARLLEGEVVMDVNYALDHEEVERGFILTCQSHPRTERLVVDFDVK